MRLRYGALYVRLVLWRASALVATAALGVLSAVGVSGCGGGEGSTALSTRLDETRLILTLTIGSTTAERTTPTRPTTTTRPTTPTATRTTPSPPTVTRTVATTTVSVTQSETTVVAPIAPVTTVVTTTAVVAVAETTEPESTQWGWISFGILAAAVIVAGIVWWLRGRHDRGAPPVGP
jgi:hypothetical protein